MSAFTRRNFIGKAVVALSSFAKGRMTVVATGNKARTMEFQEGDVGYVPKTLLHYVENLGDTDLVFLRNVQGRSFFGHFVLGVAGPHAGGTGHGAPEDREGDLRRDSQNWRRGHAG